MAKTKPTSIRFEVDKLDFVKKEEKIETRQKVVDFLLEKYWWEKKVGGFPTMAAQDVPRESKPVPQPPSLPKINQEQAYQMEIMGAKNPAEIQRIVSVLKKDDSITKPTQLRLEQFGIQRSRELDF